MRYMSVDVTGWLNKRPVVERLGMTLTAELFVFTEVRRGIFFKVGFGYFVKLESFALI